MYHGSFNPFLTIGYSVSSFSQLLMLILWTSVCGKLFTIFGISLLWWILRGGMNYFEELDLITVFSAFSKSEIYAHKDLKTLQALLWKIVILQILPSPLAHINHFLLSRGRTRSGHCGCLILWLWEHKFMSLEQHDVSLFWWLICQVRRTA